MATKTLLEQRNKANKRKPDFLLKESKFSARVKSRWRFPRGKHSKVRQMHRGRQAMPHPGFGSPKDVRGADASGMFPVVVQTVADLEGLNPDKEAAVIGATVGKGKKLEIIKAALTKKILMLNVRNDTAQKIEEEFASRKKTKKDKLALKDKKESEKKKKAEEKQKQEAEEKKKDETASVEEKVSKEEEKQKEEQRTAEKTLTKKQ